MGTAACGLDSVPKALSDFLRLDKRLCAENPSPVRISYPLSRVSQRCNSEMASTIRNRITEITEPPEMSCLP